MAQPVGGGAAQSPPGGARPQIDPLGGLGKDPDEPSAAVMRARQAKKKGNVGLIIGIVATVIGLPILACCGVVGYMTTTVSTEVNKVLGDVEERKKTATANAEQALRQNGFTNMRNTDVSDFGTEVVVAGTANAQGFAKSFTCRFVVTQQGPNRFHWSLDELIADGETVYAKD